METKREFSSGATRDTDLGKLAFTRFMSPGVLRRYCEYLNEHRTMRDGSLRDPDNWKKGIPKDVYTESLGRHFWDVWDCASGEKEMTQKEYEDALCAIMFNAMGLLFEEKR